MGDATISIIFNLIYLVFWIAVIKKMRRQLDKDTPPLTSLNNFSQLLGQWYSYILRLGNGKWA
ncbi:MAG: hypothetical protein Fur0044_20690 [Anaerolineae bacterium]|nr:hypothetical protein [Anaerolineae bacterium]